MRNNSKKQTAASRTNGAKSSGPISAAGKARSRSNALKGGFFSQNLVVAAAGERAEDFESFKAAVWESVEPEGALQEMLTDDLVANWWRRQRVRRSESADLKSRLETLEIHHKSLRADEIEHLQLRFNLILGWYQGVFPKPLGADFHELATELGKIRSQLAATSLGVKYLSEMVHGIKRKAESTGQLSKASMISLNACAESTNEIADYVFQLWGIINTRSEKAASHARAAEMLGVVKTKEVEPKSGEDNRSRGEKEVEEWTEAEIMAEVIDLIDMLERDFAARIQVMEKIEKLQDKARFAAAILPTDGTGDRFHRAETTFDRRFYRALGALLMLKQGTNASKLLP